jgi:hypothetical protein
MNPDKLVVGKVYYDNYSKIFIEFVGKLNDTDHFVFKSTFVSGWTYHRSVIEHQVIPYTKILKTYLDINNAL